MAERIEEKVRRRFEGDTAEHKLRVLRDEGLYRHVRCNAPGTYMYGFDLVTWPGYLVICGDAGDYMFSRIEDMFQFFESDSGRINPEYWAEKLQGREMGRSQAKSYSHDALRAYVLGWARDYTEEWGDGWDIYPALLIGALEREVLCDYTMHPEEARERLDYMVEEMDVHLDYWEWDLREYDEPFLWCCYAIVWAIARYREQTREPVAA